MQKKHESKENQKESSSCNCNNRSFSQEVAEWGKLLREHWFDEFDKGWTRPMQFVFTFFGAFSYFAAVFTISIASGVLDFQINIVGQIADLLIIIILILSIFFGLILVLVPRKVGPVRLYLSGVSLPALIVFIVFLPYRFQEGF